MNSLYQNNPRAAAIDAIALAETFANEHVRVLAEAVEQIILNTEPTAAGLMRILLGKCDEIANMLDCIREDIGNDNPAP